MAHVWQLTSLELNGKTLVEGTLLHGVGRAHHAPGTIVGNMFRVLLSYFRKPFSNEKIRVLAGGNVLEVTTNSKGYFSMLADADNIKNIIIEDKHGKVLEIDQSYPIHFKKNHSSIEVISDVDDTIFLSHTASFLKRVYTTLFYRPSKRRAIAFTHGMFKFLSDSGCRITYLSKSESNLFGLIAAIIRFHELPQGALLLTPYLKLLQLLDPQKAKDYKLDHLKRLFEHLPGKQFILFGDDSQRDMAIYTSIAREYGDRIIKIFIRQTGFSRNESQEKLWRDLQGTGVATMYFQDSDEATTEIESMKDLPIFDAT